MNFLPLTETIDTPTDVIVDKFKAITGISERRYADYKLTASDLGALLEKKPFQMPKSTPKL